MKKMFKLLAIAVLLIASALPTNSAEKQFTANVLLDRCAGIGDVLCWSYLAAIRDSFMFMSAYEIEKPRRWWEFWRVNGIADICLPLSVKLSNDGLISWVEQLRNEYLTKTGGQMGDLIGEMPAYVAIIVAIRRQYPCPSAPPLFPQAPNPR
jgi:hypothetical protein